MVKSYELVKTLRDGDKPVYLVERDQEMFIAKPFSPFEPMLTKLDHKSIARCYGLGKLTQAGERLDEDFVISEYVSGSPLSALTDGLGIDYVTLYARQILEGLLYLDKNGRAHGDISGDNVIISSLDGAHFIDLGSSLFFNGANEVRPADFRADFAAPEVLFEKRMIRQSSEIYSTGVLIYHMLHAQGFKPRLEAYNKLHSAAKNRNLLEVLALYELIKEADKLHPGRVEPEFGVLNSYAVQGLEVLRDQPKLRSVLEAMLELQPNNRPNLAEAENEFAEMDESVLRVV